MQFAAVAAEVSAIAASVSATAAALALILNAWTTRRQTKAADMTNCLFVGKELATAERRVHDALGEVNSAENDEARTQADAKHTYEFRELLNLLEVLAQLSNAHSLTRSSKRYTESVLCERLAWIDTDEWMKSLIEESMSHATTFAELGRFRRKHKRGIMRLADVYAEQKGSTPNSG